jgi:hypothetical protein
VYRRSGWAARLERCCGGTYGMLFIKKPLVGLIFIASFVISTIAVILPWRARMIYLRIIDFASKITLRSTFVRDFVSERAFAQQSEKELLSREEEKED